VATYPDLEGKAVLITGAAGGLGEALALGFADQHCQLVLTDVDTEGLSRVTTRLSDQRGPVVAIPADLNDVAGCARLVDMAADRCGRLDVLVNNAAVIGRASLDDITAELFDQVISVNVRAPLFLAQAAIRHMRRRRHGRIINVASAAARTGGGYSSLACYSASKGAMLSMTKALARAAADDGILVNAVLPSNIDSPMLWGPFSPDDIERTMAGIPLHRPAQPQEVAELILWLASDASSYVTGANWDINGGWLMT
jgi:NAD(P)-dependent dehydrogenase (short-subunit alcohol dehydrogenase family)